MLLCNYSHIIKKYTKRLRLSCVNTDENNYKAKKLIYRQYLNLSPQ